jgi:hypothetical protein
MKEVDILLRMGNIADNPSCVGKTSPDGSGMEQAYRFELHSSMVSVAQFQTVRPLTVVDCSVLHGQYFKLAFLDRKIGEEVSPDRVDESSGLRLIALLQSRSRGATTSQNTSRRRSSPSCSVQKVTTASPTKARLVKRRLASRCSTLIAPYTSMLSFTK